MNSDLIPYESKQRLTPTETAEAVKIITAMLMVYSQRPPDPRDFVQRFVEDIADLPLNVIDATAHRFRKGKVEGHNNNFPPSAPAFYEAATSSLQSDLVAGRARQRIADTYRMLSAMPEPEKTDGGKAKVQALVDQFKAKATEERITAKEERRAKASRELHGEIERRMAENGGNVASPALMAILSSGDAV